MGESRRAACRQPSSNSESLIAPELKGGEMAWILAAAAASVAAEAFSLLMRACLPRHSMLDRRQGYCRCESRRWTDVGSIVFAVGSRGCGVGSVQWVE